MGDSQSSCQLWFPDFGEFFYLGIVNKMKPFSTSGDTWRSKGVNFPWRSSSISQLLFGTERGTGRNSSPQSQNQWDKGIRRDKHPDPEPWVVYRGKIHGIPEIQSISASSRSWDWNSRGGKCHGTRQLPSGCRDVEVGGFFQAKLSSNFPPESAFFWCFHPAEIAGLLPAPSARVSALQRLLQKEDGWRRMRRNLWKGWDLLLLPRAKLQKKTWWYHLDLSTWEIKTLFGFFFVFF